ncbi:hypothetical protein J132_06620 [Termitomyces sp. J132]|nr:hypothetical protein J132_06620 [Termitomyces sp. J132]
MLPPYICHPLLQRFRLVRSHPSNWPKHLLLTLCPRSSGTSYLHAFENVFSKASFDSLPECKQWDHAIKLLPDSAPSTCKVYLLVPKEQNKLDTFLQENLDSGCICPFKSLMASLVFFIKKKDSSLQLVQNY